jgi:hypothetical protein
MHSPAKPRLEILENRRVLSVFGNPWPNAGRLTLSFAPDGTEIAGFSQHNLGQQYVNSLFNELSAVGGTDAWKMEILRAFQTWAVQGNINIGLANDAGRDFGLPQLAPDAAEAGAIRLGAYPQTEEVIAINSPYNVLSGEWSGDLLFNTNFNFSIGGAGNTRDLFSVVLHEAGNIFGLADVGNPYAAMFGSYQGVRAGLAASDVASLQALYGARAADAFEGGAGNGSFSTASALSTAPWGGDPTKYMAVAAADVTTLSDVDYYSVATRPDTTSVTVHLRTAGLSLFTGKVTVYDALGQQLATATSDGPLAGDLTLVVNDLQPDATYYVRVEKGRDDVFGAGGYELKVGLQFNPATTNSTPAVTQVLGNDNSTNETFANATVLVTTPGFAANSYHHAFAAASGAADLDYYRVQAPAGAAVLTVMIQPSSTNELIPEAVVFDSAHNPVAADVLVNGDGGRYVLQVPDVTPGEQYYVLVRPVGRNGQLLSGNYYLTANFREPLLQMEGLRQGTLTQSRSQEHISLTIQESQVTQFTLSADTGGSTVVSGVRMILFNAAGQVVFTTTAVPGRAGTGTVVLQAGNYTVRYEAATQDGASPLPDLTYDMQFKRLSDPIDPFPTPDGGGDAPPPHVEVYSDGYYLSLGLTDPWLDPWQF